MTRGRSASALHSVSRLAFDQNLNVDFIRQLSSVSLDFGLDGTNTLCIEMRVSGSTKNAMAAENFRKALLPCLRVKILTVAFNTTVFTEKIVDW